MSALDLSGKAIVITGASSGIGAATARACAAAGMDVVLGARRADRLDAVAAEVRAHGRRAEVVPGDVTSASMSAQLLDAAAERFGGFHAVFANAGYGIESNMVELSDEELRRIFEVNFFSSVELVRGAARRLLARGERGHLLMCSSCLAKFTIPYYGAYAATKAAQSHVCRAMRAELRDAGIEVSSVHPITTTTEFFQASQIRRGATSDSIVPSHAPKMFVQSADRVARAVVRCLRRPRAEVWTSHIVRATAAAMTWSPGLLDIVMRRMLHDPDGETDRDAARAETAPQGEAPG